MKNIMQNKFTKYFMYDVLNKKEGLYYGRIYTRRLTKINKILWKI